MIDVYSSPYLVVLTVGLLLFLSVLSNRLSEGLGIPTLLVFLAIGMIAGSEGVGGIYFDNPAIANQVGVFALSYILFSGGFDTDLQSVKLVLVRGVILSTAGVLITALLVGLFAWYALGFQFMEALLLGAIVSSTDAAAVFSVMRSRAVGLKGNLKPILEMESGSNDPMAVFLTVSLITLITNPGQAWYELVPSFFIRMGSGLVVGVLLGLFAAWIINRLRFEFEGLYPVLTISIVLLTYGLSEACYGNGFLAVYACGIVLGNRDFWNKRYLAKFHDGLGWLMQIILFVVLGLLVFPSQLLQVAGAAVSVSLFLMFIARPAAVYIAMWRSKFSFPERTLIAWTGLRGAVPIVLATYPFLAGLEYSSQMFNVVFFVVMTSALLQGKSLMMVARWLKVDEPLVTRPKYPIEFEKRAGVQDETREFDIAANASIVEKTVVELGLPPEVLILLIRRGQSFLVPKGMTRIEAFDTLLLIGPQKQLKEAGLLLHETLPPH